EQLARHALTHTPDDPTVLVLLADQELQQALAGDTAQWTAAREHYRRAVENTPAASNGVVRRTLSAGKLGLAWCLAFDPTRARPAPAQVLAAFEDAIAAGPENPAAWVGLGVARGMAGQDGPADEAFERALALDPDNSEAWCNRGYLHLQHRRFAAAADCLDRALRADPGNARARELRSQVPRAR
ncbi:MAG: tetratricopeptide repeat protein, partial [Planctomycetes bacterium]|nr:tetratricopeptide repeat protein [Planctomycetota bacterium]